ncbi:unnamed protein product [Arabidopsis thaliana]|uniref:(thale cress) hypothetical protein n=1 Tax=Arabidopsis thaliana TaxID=3702 RepID=A0A7G2EC35_ARATH|nr:unnamed protein product [Arabidopsis thaliana]
MFPRSPKVDEERRRKAKICAQGFALAYRNSFRNEPAPVEAEEQQHSAEHHHHSPELTQNGENINFYPPIHALYDAPENIPPPRPEPPHPGYDETDEQPQDEASEYFPERFYFDPYVATRKSRSERAAHQRVGMLQGLAKLHGKVVKGLTKKVESLTHAVKEMGLQIKELQRKHKSPPPLQVKETELSVEVILRAWRIDLSEVRTRLSLAKDRHLSPAEPPLMSHGRHPLLSTGRR